MQAHILSQLIEAQDSKSISDICDLQRLSGREYIISVHLSEIVLKVCQTNEITTKDIHKLNEKIQEIQRATPEDYFQSAVSSVLYREAVEIIPGSPQTIQVLSKYVSDREMANIATKDLRWEFKYIITNELESRKMLDEMALPLAAQAISRAINEVEVHKNPRVPTAEFEKYINTYPKIKEHIVKEHIGQDSEKLKSYWDSYWKHNLNILLYRAKPDFAIKVLDFAEKYCGNIKSLISQPNNLMGFAIEKGIPEVVEWLAQRGANCENILLNATRDTLRFIEEKSKALKCDSSSRPWEKKMEAEWETAKPRLLKAILPHTKIGEKAMKMAEKVYPEKTREELINVITEAYIKQREKEENDQSYSR